MEEVLIWYTGRMFGVLLASISSALSELGDTIGKKKTGQGACSQYTLGFLNSIGAAVFLVTIGFMRHDLVFSLASLPTFLPRLVLEVLQAHVTVRAIIRADRSDFGPIRTLTIPLLLIADLVLGYHVHTGQIIGMGIIFATIFALLSYERFKTKGLSLLLFTAVNAAITLTLFKYDISHFNSVESEQSIVIIVLVLYFFILAVVRARENPLLLLFKRAFFVQAVSGGLSSVVVSYAYTFAAASIVTAALRASAVLFSLISGKLYFREGGFIMKLFLFCVIAAGLFLLL